MPNRKTDTNNRQGFSTDFIGRNYDYPEADYATRSQIAARHRAYQQGLMWTLANHPRVPDAIRHEVGRWGMTRDEFGEGRGWQEQLYIREARRMSGAYVMTQHNCQGRERVEDAIGLAAYTMDSHNVQRYVTEDGFARNEGDVQVGGFPPYPISYRAITPRPEECPLHLVDRVDPLGVIENSLGQRRLAAVDVRGDSDVSQLREVRVHSSGSKKWA
jgi:hypothetical protein